MELSNNTLHVSPDPEYNRIVRISAVLPRVYDFDIRKEAPFFKITRNDNGKEIEIPSNWGHHIWEIFLWDEERPRNLDLVVMLTAHLVRHFDENEVIRRLNEMAYEVNEAFDNAWRWWATRRQSVYRLDRLAWAARRLMIRKIEREDWVGNLVKDHSYHLMFEEMELYSEIRDE